MEKDCSVRHNCSIVEINGILSGVGGTNRKIYEVLHSFSHEMLHVISLAKAFRAARLLNLEWSMQEIQEVFFPTDYDS